MKQLLIFILLLAVSGCGTDTGNPGINGESLPTQDPALETAPDGARSVAAQICTTLAACNTGLDTMSCSSSVLSVSGLPSYLGYSNYNTLNDVASDAGKSVNNTYLQSCLTELNAVNCGSSRVSNSFSPATPTNFSNVSQLFGDTTSCSQVGL
jgi:hypothetical protein